jgi:hypothetical protein
MAQVHLSIQQAMGPNMLPGKGVDSSSISRKRAEKAKLVVSENLKGQLASNHLLQI